MRNFGPFTKQFSNQLKGRSNGPGMAARPKERHLQAGESPSFQSITVKPDQVDVTIALDRSAGVYPASASLVPAMRRIDSCAPMQVHSFCSLKGRAPRSHRKEHIRRRTLGRAMRMFPTFAPDTAWRTRQKSRLPQTSARRKSKTRPRLPLARTFCSG